VLEITLLCGFPAAGKTTIAKKLEESGYVRLNRDTEGGSIADLLKPTEVAIKNGQNVLLDNTFLTIESREPFIELAKGLKTPIRCVWLATSFEDAQMNACLRMLQRVGHIMSPEELKATKDPNLFPPAAIFAAKSQWEGKDKSLKYSGKQIPLVEHGFCAVEKIEFKRTWPDDFINKALILDFDGTLRESSGAYDWPTKPEEVQILPGRTEIIQQYQKGGYLILGASNQSAISKGLAEKDAIACFEQTKKLLGVDIEYTYCPHSVPPVKCYCRKPSVGIGAAFIWNHKLNPADCLFVGDMTSDQTFAQRCGFKFQFARDFFGDKK
jgi:D-glycero-D-manno-heptose 1,7-bisphosphate phosphatase